MTLETTRLILRPWRESDAEDLFEYARDPRVGLIAGWPPHRNVEESLEIIRTVFAQEETYAICRKTDGLLMGCIGLQTGENTDMTDRTDEAEVGYWLGVPFWGKGYMPEAVKELQRHVFEDLHMRALWCGYYQGNERSRRVQEKCGFSYVRTTEGLELPLLGETRTGICNLLTREDWEKTRLIVRPAYRDELPRINEIRCQVNDLHVAGRPDIFRPGFGAELQNLLFERYNTENWRILAAVLDGTVCGFASVEYLDRPQSPYNLARKMYHVEEFGVDSAFRRRGVGSALVAYMKRDAQEKGFSRIELDMWEFNQGALKFYESAGFRTYRRYMELYADGGEQE